MVIEEDNEAPLTMGEAITYIKKRNIYEKLLKLFSQAKQETTIKEFLNFFGFLFENDHENISGILKTIYEKIGPSETFLRWMHRISKRASSVMIDIFSETNDLTPFENLTQSGY